jgi:hypothetical protein
MYAIHFFLYFCRNFKCLPYPSLMKPRGFQGQNTIENYIKLVCLNFYLGMFY